MAEAKTLGAGLADINIEVRGKASSPVPKDTQYHACTQKISLS